MLLPYFRHKKITKQNENRIGSFIYSVVVYCFIKRYIIRPFRSLIQNAIGAEIVDLNKVSVNERVKKSSSPN